MELSPKQQISELIKSSNNILLVTHESPDSDGVGGMIALSLVLEKLGKKTTMIAPGFDDDYHHFLPSSDKVMPSLVNSKDFVISLDITNTKVEKILYKRIDNDRLDIIVTPGNGSQINQDEIKFSSAGYGWDLIIVLDCATLERTGSVQESEPALFYEKPIINIDHHAGNDFFGKVNLVEITATSTSEVLVPLIESLGRENNLIDENVATCLLTGIMGDTSSFQNSNTTPKSLTVAAQLVAAGARQQEIVRNLFKTKSLSTLKLWGKALAKLQEESDEKFVWSALTKEEIDSTGAKPEQTGGLIDELLKTASGVDFALLISERNGAVHGSLRAVSKSIDVSIIAALFDGGGHAAASAFDIPNSTLSDQQQNIIFKIKQYQAKRLQA
jgi:phosphoesterase RecJ-like protein